MSLEFIQVVTTAIGLNSANYIYSAVWLENSWIQGSTLSQSVGLWILINEFD